MEGFSFPLSRFCPHVSLSIVFTRLVPKAVVLAPLSMLIIILKITVEGI